MNQTASQPRALDGRVVVDLTQGMCGPFASHLLATAGAEIIKVEPLAGDYARQFGPPFVGDQSAVFLALNRSKQSIALDLDAPKGADVLRRLLGIADIVLEDFAPHETARRALLDGLAESVVRCSITAFGEEGPLRDQPGSELVLQAMSDFSGSLGAIGEPPERLGGDVANLNTGIFAFDAILAAMFHRDRTGEGQRVSVSQWGTLLHMRSIIWAAQSDPDEWYGFHCDTYTKPRDHGYRTADLPIYFAPRRMPEDSWVSLLDELGLLEVAVEDPRFDNGGREAVGLGRYAHEVKPIWEEAFKQFTAGEVVELLRRFGAEAVPLNDHQSLLAHPQVQAMELVSATTHPTAGPVQALLPPWRFDATQPSAGNPSPLLGQHTEAILERLSYDREVIQGLESAGIIARGTPIRS